MTRGLKNLLVATGIAVLIFILNGAIFVYFYNHLTTPFIGEEQRVSNADYIMSVVLSSYAGVSLIIGMVVYFIIKNHR